MSIHKNNTQNVLSGDVDLADSQSCCQKSWLMDCSVVSILQTLYTLYWSWITPWHGNFGEPNWRWIGKKDWMRVDETFARQERNNRDTV